MSERFGVPVEAYLASKTPGAEADKAILAERNRCVAALREIAVGKTAADLEHPLGEGWSMAARFITIAQNALRGDR